MSQIFDRYRKKWTLACAAGEFFGNDKNGTALVTLTDPLRGQKMGRPL